jgi:hypothetical protein
MSKHPKHPRVRPIGKTIRLDYIKVPDILGFGAFLVAPDADERVPYTFKSTDGNDLILISGYNWRNTIMIDGGGGVNEIQGTFGVGTLAPSKQSNGHCLDLKPPKLRSISAIGRALHTLRCTGKTALFPKTHKINLTITL